jgi:hypothetical protein
MDVYNNDKTNLILLGLAERFGDFKDIQGTRIVTRCQELMLGPRF